MRKLAVLLALTCLSVGLQATLIPYNDKEPIPMLGDASPANEEILINGLALGCPEDLACEFIGKVPTGIGEDDPYGFISRGLITVDPSLAVETREATLTWDLTGTGWELCAVLVKADGHYNVYAPDWESKVEGSGTVTAVRVGDKAYGISHITFLGHHVPDGGTTVLLLGMSLLGIGWIQRRSAASSHR